MKEPSNILNSIYNKASRILKQKNTKIFVKNYITSKQFTFVNTIMNKAETQKAILAALTTVLVKKIIDPKQDIRLHKIELIGGFSGRSLDTKYVTPFFKDKFTRLAMKESGWLTRSIEQAHSFNLKFPGKIRDKEIKNAFLQIIKDVQDNKANPEKYLLILFILLIRETKKSNKKIKKILIKEELSIDIIFGYLKKHFFAKYSVAGASKLPVIAIHSIYKSLLKDAERYKNKKLLSLKSHISSDFRSKSIGDIEIVDANNDYFEVVEVKHKIPIDKIMVKDCFLKFKDKPVKRYYLLTTSDPNILKGHEEEVKSLTEEIKKIHGCEVITNGIMNSLKYYLRLIQSPGEFINNYTSALRSEFLKSSEIKKQHIDGWLKIIKKK